jgi:hypothetical protein
MSLPYFSASRKKWLYPKDFENPYHLRGAIRKLEAAIAAPNSTTQPAEITRLRLILEGLKDEARRRGI